MKTITIIGFFAFNTEYNGGQENKTRTLADLLKAKMSDYKIITIDTLKWKKNPFKLFFNTIRHLRKSDIVIMMPARNGVKVFSKILTLFKSKKTKLFYSVIGGWLPSITENNFKLKQDLLKFNGIWVETKSMANDLENQGFNNIKIIPNFKKINPINSKKIEIKSTKPYKVCTFSRILKEKGIEDAIDVVTQINEKYNEIIYELDLYGRIDSNYEEQFSKLQSKFPSYIKYKGVVPFNDSVVVLKKYFFLLFPTHFPTEGIPGTIIDAYASALPIVSAKWNSYNDIIKDNVTGIGYTQLDNKELFSIMEKIYKKPQLINEKRINCLKEFSKYTEDYAFKLIKKEIEKEEE